MPDAPLYVHLLLQRSQQQQASGLDESKAVGWLSCWLLPLSPWHAACGFPAAQPPLPLPE